MRLGFQCERCEQWHPTADAAGKCERSHPSDFVNRHLDPLRLDSLPPTIRDALLSRVDAAGVSIDALVRLALTEWLSGVGDASARPI